MLDGLKERLLTPELTEEFCREYARAMNRLRAEKETQSDRARKDLTRVVKEIAGIIAAVAVQPALVAARSAPRLWTWLIVAWFVSITFSDLPQALVRVHPEDLTHAQALFPAAAVMSVGLAVASTALSGVRRHVLPLTVALGLAILAHANALPWAAASASVI